MHIETDVNYVYTEEMRNRDKAKMQLAAMNVRNLIKIHGREKIMALLNEEMDRYLDKFTRADGTVDVIAMMRDDS